MKPKVIAAAACAVLAVAAVIAAVSVAGGPKPAPAPPAADPAHAPPPSTRVLIVSKAMPEPSRPGLTLHGRLDSGRMPHSAMHGTVMSDSECGAGFDGISRCRNEVKLADGSTIVVRHPHDMSKVPCLSPGEQVRVRPS